MRNVAKNLFAAGVLTSSLLMGGGAGSGSGVPVPPSINLKSEKDRLFILMLRIYDLHKEQFDSVLGVIDCHPKAIDSQPPTNVEITDEAKKSKYCNELSVDAKKVAKVVIAGTEIDRKYYFMSEKGAIYASAVARKCVSNDAAVKPENKDVGTFTATHLPGVGKVVFGFTPGGFLHKGPPEPRKVIEVGNDPAKQVFSVSTDGAKGTESLGVYTRKTIEEQVKALTDKKGQSRRM